jgi:hypothetical protein
MAAEKDVIVVPKDVRKEIENLLRTRLYLPSDIILIEGRDYPFFGLRGLLNSRGLTYLTHLLETQYDIRFGMEEYDDPMFYSLDGLSEIVARLVKDRDVRDIREPYPC